MLLETVGKILSSLPSLLTEDSIGITPSLLHGDLWIGNTGLTRSGEVAAFDPAPCFGHHEFDLALMRMYGGYTDAFWDAYHALIPRSKNFQVRAKVYGLYYYLNQLNIFGDDKVKVTCEGIAMDVVKCIAEIEEKEG